MLAETKRRISVTVSQRMRDQWKVAKVCDCGSRFRGQYEKQCWRCRIKSGGK